MKKKSRISLPRSVILLTGEQEEAIVSNSLIWTKEWMANPQNVNCFSTNKTTDKRMKQKMLEACDLLIEYYTIGE